VIILDTDILSIVQRASGPEYEILANRLDSVADDVVVSIVTFEEQMRGWLAFIARAKSLNQQIVAYAKLHALVDDFSTRPILDFDQSSAMELEKLRRSKVSVGTMDLRIAAMALAHNALLISRNLVHFERVPNLRVEDWTLG